MTDETQESEANKDNTFLARHYCCTSLEIAMGFLAQGKPEQADKERLFAYHRIFDSDKSACSDAYLAILSESSWKTRESLLEFVRRYLEIEANDPHAIAASHGGTAR